MTDFGHDPQISSNSKMKKKKKMIVGVATVRNFIYVVGISYIFLFPESSSVVLLFSESSSVVASVVDVLLLLTAGGMEKKSGS